MDEVLGQFQRTLISQTSDDDNKTSFDCLYKNWGRLGNQEERRKELLDVQKSNRNGNLDKFRGIIELVQAVEDGEDIFQLEDAKPAFKPSIYVAGFTKTSLSYNNVLMLSEWMIEKPWDFNENWYVVPCPKGVRMLVVANQGTTKCYTRHGQFRLECRTALPGGNPYDNRFRKHCCVVDCFYYEATSTMYVIDLLAWNSQPMTDGEAEFRHYWLETNLGDIAESKTINRRNKLIFSILPFTRCTPESFNKFMKIPHFVNGTPALDGLLFYHKKAHYVNGETPLVGWLYPYMVPEVLGPEITVSEYYMVGKPIDYVDQSDYIKKFEEKRIKRKTFARVQLNKNAMETSDPTDDKKTSKKKGRKSKNRTVSAHNEEMEADTTPSQEEDTFKKIEEQNKEEEGMDRNDQ